MSAPLVHYKTSKAPLALDTACGTSAKPQPQTLLPRLVTCPVCLDWIAHHHGAVIARLGSLRAA